MFFQEPRIEYITVFPVIVTESSNPVNEIEFCKQNHSTHPETVTTERYCAIMTGGTTLGRQEICDTFDEEPDMVLDINKGSVIADTSIKQAVGASPTVAPVRSAPHFNNDLFK